VTHSLHLDPLVGAEDIKPSPVAARPSWWERKQNEWKKRWDDMNGDPVRRGKFRRNAAIAAVVLLLAGGGAYWKWGMVHQPDFAVDDLEDIFDYTLLTDDFNKLPLDQRLALLSELVKRLKSSSTEDSVMMAAFASGIAGAAREQLMKNSSQLGIDMWDRYAKKYDEVPPEDKEAYIEDSLVNMMKMMEAVGGVQRDISDEDRIKEMKRQSQRDMKRAESGRGPSGAMAGRMFDFLANNVAKNASAGQRSRGTQMMRDTTRYLRGESLNKPKVPEGDKPEGAKPADGEKTEGGKPADGAAPSEPR
jgi:hypothetical protein